VGGVVHTAPVREDVSLAASCLANDKGQLAGRGLGRPVDEDGLYAAGAAALDGVLVEGNGQGQA
jgi:hypothetical protein